MKIEVVMIKEDRFVAESWWATDPAFVLNTLRGHLNAAAIIWPELASYHLDLKQTLAATEPKP